MILITKPQMKELLKNGATHYDDHRPVVKLFTPDGAATWLIDSADPEDPDLLYGLCDLGFGAPELGFVRLTEIKAVRGQLGLPAERDLYFEPQLSLGEYARASWEAGRIIV